MTKIMITKWDLVHLIKSKCGYHSYTNIEISKMKIFTDFCNHNIKGGDMCDDFIEVDIEEK